MELQENISLKSKTTMRIGGDAHYYAELSSKEGVEQAYRFVQEKGIPLIVLGGGSNTVFADETIEALVVRIAASNVEVDGTTAYVAAGKNLAQLINELADQNLDLSPLTGIPGSVGGAIFGNAGQGPEGVWIDSYIESVTAFVDGEWKEFSKEECDFSYRESGFKHMQSPPLIWSAALTVPRRDAEEIKNDVEALLQKRIETQPHVKTAGSLFKAVDGTPAWKLIDAAGLRGLHVGDIEVSEKHANFLLNKGNGTYEDLKKVVETIEDTVPETLEREMRFVENA